MNDNILKILDAIRDRCDKATCGEWTADTDEDANGMREARVKGADGLDVCTVNLEGVDERDYLNSLADTKFIAHSRTDLDRTEKALREAVEFMECYTNGTPTTEQREILARGGLAHAEPHQLAKYTLARIRAILEGKDE